MIWWGGERRKGWGEKKDQTILLLYSGEIRNRGRCFLVAPEKSREGFLLCKYCRIYEEKFKQKLEVELGKVFCANTNLGNAQFSFLNAEFFLVSRLYKTFALFFFLFCLHSFIHSFPAPPPESLPLYS